MSAYKTIQVTLKDKATLLTALETLGFKPQVHETPKSLRGYENDVREQVAEIVLPKAQVNRAFTGSYSNDIGFTWNAELEQYDMICSDFDESFALPSRVTQAYAVVAIEQAMQKKRHHISERTDSAQLQCRRRVVAVVAGERIV